MLVAKASTSGHAPVVGLGHRLGIERDQIGLDRGVEPVEHVVQPLGLGDPRAVVPLEGVAQALQHGFEHVRSRSASRAAPPSATTGVSRAAGSR